MKDRNEVTFSNEAEGQLTDLKEHNWNLKDESLREKFGHVLFPRLDAAIISLKSEQDFQIMKRKKCHFVI